jgi:TnpA family transposase
MILRRFTRKNVQHPTYKGFAELGKVIKGTGHSALHIESKEARLGLEWSVME